MTITAEIVGLVIMILGVVAGAWWRVDGAIKAARTEALAAIVAAVTKSDNLAAEFAAYRTHVAETYVTKEGLREQTRQLLDALGELKSGIGHINDRIDQVLVGQAPPAGRRSRAPP